METIDEYDLGDVVPSSHAFFLPKDEGLEPAPFEVVGQTDESVEAVGSDVASSTQPCKTLPRAKPTLAEWRRRRSGSRVRHVKTAVCVVRLSDAKACFGRRTSPAPGSTQQPMQRRTQGPPTNLTPKILGTASSARDVVARRARGKRWIKGSGSRTC